VHYLHGPGFPSHSVDLVEATLAACGATVRLHEVAPERLEGLRIVDEFTGAMWYRLFLPELVPEADRILYLDADTIALGPVDPLWLLDLDAFYLAAVTNVFMPYHRHRPAELGLSSPTDYFNSGVLLMNLDAMRRDNSTAAMLDFARRNPFGWPDQDTLNLVLGDRRLPLHPQWNYMNAMRTPSARETFSDEVLAQAAERPIIRHFEGPGANKPWHPDSDVADRELYLRHRRAVSA
jgi:lipopolysaccharide biosynthesis glycosyltransferase